MQFKNGNDVNTPMKYLLVIIGLGTASCCYSQEPTVRVGVFAGELLKVNIYEVSGIKAAIPAMTSLGLALEVHGTSENSSSFLLPVEICDDHSYYSPQAGVKLVLYNNWININPTLLVPSRWPRLRYSLGIGAMVNAGRDVGLSTSSSTGYIHTLVDSTFNRVQNGARTILPFLSAGLHFKLRTHWDVQLLISQPLLNYYGDDVDIYFYVNGLQQFLHLSYLPTCFGARIYYFIQ